MATFSCPDSKGLIVTTTVTIANGQSLSGAVDLNSFSLLGLLLPAAWTAAGLTFQASPDNVTFGSLWDKSSEVTLTSAAAGVFIALDPTIFVGVRFVKVRSGIESAPVNQGADRIVTLVLRPL